MAYKDEPMLVERVPTICSLSQTSFEWAISQVGKLAGKDVTHVTLVISAEEVFTAARLVKEYEEEFVRRSYVHRGFIPPSIHTVVHYSAPPEWWAVLFERCMVWSPGA